MKKIVYILLASIISFSNFAHAQTQKLNSLYVVDVHVDVTEDNAALAKEKAMTQANKTAFNTVARKVTNQEGIEALGSLNDDQILNFIKEISITSEKASNVRYIANLKVTINDEVLKQYMEEKEIPSAVITASKVLLIPTFREFKTDPTMLWEANNIWRKVWEEESSKKEDIIEFVSIPANGSNYASLDAKKAIDLDVDAMKKIAENNGTDDIFIVDAVYNGIEGLTINVYSVKDKIVETVEVYGERAPQLILDSIAEVKKNIENRLKKQIIAESTQKNELVALYTYETMADWVRVEKSLKEVNGVNDVNMTAMSSGKVQFKIDYSGTIENLIKKMEDHFFSLKQDGEFYSLEKM